MELNQESKNELHDGKRQVVSKSQAKVDKDSELIDADQKPLLPVKSEDLRDDAYEPFSVAKKT